MVIDKWTFDAGDFGGYRFRWNLTAAQQTALNNAKTFYMHDGTNNWHMVTHDYSLSFKADTALVSPVTSVESTGSSDLEVILNSPSGPHAQFENAMAGSDFYNGAVLTITKTLNDGNKLDIVRIVKNYDGTNKIATLTEPYSLVPNDHNIKLYPEDNDIVTIKVGHDKRVSTNPALIAYDYMTNKRYGPGVEQVDINQNSFLNAAITCDTTSDITVTLATAATFKKGAVYKWVSGVFKWQGTVKADATSSTSVTFTNCIGKLTNKWNNWKERQVGDGQTEGLGDGCVQD